MRKIFLIAVLILLAACGRGAGDYSEAVHGEVEHEYTPVFEEIEEATDIFVAPEPIPGDTTIRVSDEISIMIYRLENEQKYNFLAKYETFFEFAEYGGGGIAIVANYPLRNFRYLRISGAEIAFIVKSDLFSLDELPPETPLFVDWGARGSGAYSGFSFDDEHGAVRYFAFNYCAAGFSAFRYMEFDGGLSLEDVQPYPPEPIRLTVTDIPQNTEPTEFLRGLGYDSYTTHEFLQWGENWIAIRTNTAIQDLRIIEVIPRYTAIFDGGWQMMRHYVAYPWERAAVSISPAEPFVMAWDADERGISDGGLMGVAFVDFDGHERFFRLQEIGGDTHLVEFENTLHTPSEPRITTIRPSAEIELVAAWFAPWWNWLEDEYVANAKRNFLRQFDTYTEFENSSASFASWVVFGANTDLHDFRFFGLGQVCNPWVGDEFHFFFVSEVLDEQAFLPFGEALVIPWNPGGTMPRFGISFLDENGTRRKFTINSNEGSGFPPKFISEFTDRIYCPNCAT